LDTCWQWVSAHATVSLWESNGDPTVAKIVSDLEKVRDRRPTVRECQALAERREVTLPETLVKLTGDRSACVRIYDLRHTFASVGAGGGLSLLIIGRLLGHTQSKTTQRYAHLADDPLREAAEKITRVITGAGQAGAKVTAIKG